MRQIGVRDEARWLKGYGSCGRPLCCSSYINKFEPVTLKMAKDQLLSLNPTKLSGVCGRLMCCLSYERDFYRSELKKYPYLGMKVEYAGKRGRVSKYNVFKELIYIQFTDGSEEKVPLEKMNKEILPLKSSSNWVVDEYEEFDDFEDHEI
jgi:cell fate regulator YaaT (PSP1 superfamily)